MSVPIFDVTPSQLREWDADPQSPFVLGSDGVWDDLYIIVRALARHGSRIGDVRPMPCGFLDWDEALSSADNLNAWDLEYALSDESCVVAEYEVWHVVSEQNRRYGTMPPRDFGLFDEVELYAFLGEYWEFIDVAAVVDESTYIDDRGNRRWLCGPEKLAAIVLRHDKSVVA